mmetsp:Transcript_42495/g.95368  ORF Transcript_42495/g.95368 Transcript_42495/m.95368 type:complete len:247 (-) Transcript_42495:65-805(-)
MRSVYRALSSARRFRRPGRRGGAPGGVTGSGRGTSYPRGGRMGGRLPRTGPPSRAGGVSPKAPLLLERPPMLPLVEDSSVEPGLVLRDPTPEGGKFGPRLWAGWRTAASSRSVEKQGSKPLSTAAATEVLCGRTSAEGSWTLSADGGRPIYLSRLNSSMEGCFFLTASRRSRAARRAGSTRCSSTPRLLSGWASATPSSSETLEPRSVDEGLGPASLCTKAGSGIGTGRRHPPLGTEETEASGAAM